MRSPKAYYALKQINIDLKKTMDLLRLNEKNAGERRVFARKRHGHIVLTISVLMLGFRAKSNSIPVNQPRTSHPLGRPHTGDGKTTYQKHHQKRPDLTQTHAHSHPNTHTYPPTHTPTHNKKNTHTLTQKHAHPNPCTPTSHPWPTHNHKPTNPRNPTHASLAWAEFTQNVILHFVGRRLRKKIITWKFLERHAPDTLRRILAVCHVKTHNKRLTEEMPVCGQQQITAFV